MIYKIISLNWTGVSDCMLMLKKLKINKRRTRSQKDRFVSIYPSCSAKILQHRIHGFIPGPEMFVPNVKTLQT